MGRSTGTEIHSCKTDEMLMCEGTPVYNLHRSVLFQMSPWCPWKMCTLCSIRGNRNLSFFQKNTTAFPLNICSAFGCSLLMKTTWTTWTRRWSTCHSTLTSVSWRVEQISKWRAAYDCFTSHVSLSNSTSPGLPAEGSLPLWRTSAVR